MSEPSKQTWRDFICSSSSGSRLLSSVGSAVVRSSIPFGCDENEVREFLLKLRGEQRDVRVIAGIVDLLNPEYLNFLTHDTPLLLDHLSNEVVKKEEVLGPALRGNPRWDKTILGRMTRTLPIGKYYSRTAHRSFEKPENLLIKWLLNNLSDEIHSLERQLGIDAIPLPLRVLFSKIEAITRHHWLADIPTPSRLTSDMCRAAQHNRRPEYRLAAKLAIRRRELDQEIAHKKWKAVLSLLASNWLEPVDADDLFELYSLTICLEVISNELGYGSPKELGLVMRQRKYVAKFISETGSLEVYFDQSPRTTLGISGKYLEILRAHTGVNGNTHRPDITVVQKDGAGNSRTLLVEVKRTRSREYLSESIYKAFSYLHDFAEIWATKNSTPKVVLMVPDEPRLLPGIEVPDVAFVSAADRTGLSNLMLKAFTT